MDKDKAIETIDALIGLGINPDKLFRVRKFIIEQDEAYQNLRTGIGRLFADLAQNRGENHE